MYHDYFRLTCQPFANLPDTELFYPGAKRAAVLEALVYAIHHGDALLKVVGEVGCGKTMLCRMLEQRLSPETDVLYLANPNLTPDDILQALALEMNLDVPAGFGKVQLQHAVQQRLLERHAKKRRVVLLIEEAQSMPLETLEEIRMLSNLETREQKLLQIVLFGQPELEAKLSRRSARQLTERISHSFYLEPFSSKEVCDYVVFRLTERSASRLPNLFSRPSLKLLSWVSRGLARRVNFIADKALLAAFSDRAPGVRLSHVLRAVKDCDFGARWLHQRTWAAGGIAMAIVLGATTASMNAARLAVPQAESEESSTATELANPARVDAAPALAASNVDIALVPRAPVKPASAPVAVIEPDIADLVSRTQRRMANRAAGLYTLQVMTSRASRATEAAGLTRLLRHDDLAPWSDALLLHEGQSNTESVFVVSLGMYASYAEARDAAEHLPERLQRYHPLARTIDSLRRELGAQP